MADSPQLPSVSLSLDPAGVQLANNLSRIAVILLERAPDEAIERMWDDFLDLADGFDAMTRGVAGALKRVRRQISPKRGTGTP